METLSICLIFAILGTFISDLLASIIVSIVDAYQTYKQKKQYKKERSKK